MITIAIDFDGTIVDHAYPIIGKPAPGALGWIRRFIELEAKVILWTMRDGDSLSDAKKYLSENDIPELHGYNNNPTQKFWTQSPKVLADVYIDDRGLGCPLIMLDGYDRPCVDWSVVGYKVEDIILRDRGINI